MAEKNDDQEKTEEPTAHKLEKAREEGNVSHSAELSSVMLMVMTTIVFMQAGSWMFGRIRNLFQVFLDNTDQAIDNPQNAIKFMNAALFLGLEVLAPILIALFITAILVNIAQTGVVFSTKVIEPKGNRIDPLNGIKRIFSVRGLVELIKGFSKIFIVGLVIYFTVRSKVTNFITFAVTPIDDMLSQTGHFIILIMARILSALLILSILDTLYQRFQHRKDLRMTKQEVKDEFKQMEGDPHIKSKRKQIARQNAQRRRLDHAILGSDVVVTNPTHYAVAMHYDPEHNDAPMIMAKGTENRAFKIRDFAKKYDITIVEDPPVARALYATADEGEFVPPELYQAVAEILAYVYKMKKHL
ncbi:MAG TPA: flagellar biosynthesis protein FlhB [Balneolales bacterium]|nr:flagellar biosynthesis protein FlhB [Balneolales bacterium]